MIKVYVVHTKCAVFSRGFNDGKLLFLAALFSVSFFLNSLFLAQGCGSQLNAEEWKYLLGK